MHAAGAVTPRSDGRGQRQDTSDGPGGSPETDGSANCSSIATGWPIVSLALGDNASPSSVLVVHNDGIAEQLWEVSESPCICDGHPAHGGAAPLGDVERPLSIANTFSPSNATSSPTLALLSPCFPLIPDISKGNDAHRDGDKRETVAVIVHQACSDDGVFTQDLEQPVTQEPVVSMNGYGGGNGARERSLLFPAWTPADVWVRQDVTSEVLAGTEPGQSGEGEAFNDNGHPRSATSDTNGMLSRRHSRRAKDVASMGRPSTDKEMIPEDRVGEDGTPLARLGNLNLPEYHQGISPQMRLSSSRRGSHMVENRLRAKEGQEFKQGCPFQFDQGAATGSQRDDSLAVNGIESLNEEEQASLRRASVLSGQKERGLPAETARPSMQRQLSSESVLSIGAASATHVTSNCALQDIPKTVVSPMVCLTPLKRSNEAIGMQLHEQEKAMRLARAGCVTSNSSRPVLSVGDGRFIAGVSRTLDEDDVELVEEEPILTEQTSLFGIRRRLVGRFESLGAKTSTALSAKSSMRSGLAASSTTAGMAILPRQENTMLGSEKEIRKREEALGAREKDLTIEAISKAEMAYVTFEVWTESRSGKWAIRGPATDDDEPPEQLPCITDPWAFFLDSKGIVRRKKLKSNVEMSSTRTVVECPECTEAGRLGIYTYCRACDDSGRVEMVYSVQCVVRLAHFLPLKLPAVLLLGRKQEHIKYMNAADPGERIDILRDRALDGLQSAAGRVVTAHYAQHGSRLLMGRATISRRGLLSVCVTSSKTKSKRFFDVEDGQDGALTEVTHLHSSAALALSRLPSSTNSGTAKTTTSPLESLDGLRSSLPLPLCRPTSTSRTGSFATLRRRKSSRNVPDLTQASKPSHAHNATSAFTNQPDGNPEQNLRKRSLLSFFGR